MQGNDVTWPFVLTFMWLFGIAFTVEKALQLSDPDSQFSLAAYVFNISVGAFWWVILIVITTNVITS
jgi:hypothetical protein